MPDLVHREVIERFNDAWRSDRENRDDAFEDLRFAAGDQWLDSVRRSREREGKPVITVNRMGQFIRQVSGDLRQSAPSIDPIPVEGEIDEQITEIYAGLIRQIEYQSNASAAYSAGAEHAITCGIGHWRIETDFVTDSVFDQEIKIKRVPDPLSVTWDANSVELDRSDAMYCFISEMITDDEFAVKYPRGSDADFPDGISRGYSNLYWRDDSKTRVAEYWYKVPVKRRLALMSTGETLDLTDFSQNDMQFLRDGIVRMRDADAFEIKQILLNASDFLDDPQDWAGSHIPIVPVLGNEIPLNGQTVRHGIVRWAKDPQRLYNYWRSAAAEHIGNSPKAPFIGPAELFEGHEDAWSQANNTNFPYLPYNPIEGAPQIRPQREQAAQPPAAIWGEATVATDDMNATTGLFPPALGQQSNEKSGRAIIARQREGDTGSFIYFDNFNQAIRRTGQILVDLIPKIYDGDRVIRILGNDETENFVPINRRVQTFEGEELLVNDLSAGRFDVRIKTGPSYMTARLEAQDQLTQILQGAPNLMMIMGDLWFENMDFPGAEKIAERMRKAMDPRIVGEEDSEMGQQQQDPMAEIAARLQLEQAQAETEKTEAEAADKAASAEGKQLDNMQKAFEFGLNT